MKSALILLSVFFLTGFCSDYKAQAGIDVTPPRSYYTSAAGESRRSTVMVTNASKTSPLVLSISLSDWKYDENGNNVIAEPGTLPNSAAPWITVKPQSYFTLAPGESQELEVTVTPPAKRFDTLDVHTALLFITQTNPIDSYEKGVLVKISLRSGIKIYHRYSGSLNPNIEFQDYQVEKNKGVLLLEMQNKGNSWTDGTVVTELVNQNDGTKYSLADQIIHTLPGDRRSVRIPLPQNLKPGKYIATSTVAYGDDDTIKMAELTFIHE